jgi:DNA-binding IclR family transcriptional regulator
MTVKKIDPREALVNRKSWQDDDAVIELVEAQGQRTVLTRAQARVPAWQVRRWLRIGQLPAANGACARVLQAFMSSDAHMFYPEGAPPGRMSEDTQDGVREEAREEAREERSAARLSFWTDALRACAAKVRALAARVAPRAPRARNP